MMFICFLNFSGKIVKIDVDPLFSEQKRLKKSKLRDKRDKSYPCGICDYVATKSSHLKTHIRNKHGVDNQASYVITLPLQKVI